MPWPQQQIQQQQIQQQQPPAALELRRVPMPLQSPAPSHQPQTTTPAMARVLGGLHHPAPPGAAGVVGAAGEAGAAAGAAAPAARECKNTPRSMSTALLRLAGVVASTPTDTPGGDGYGGGDEGGGAGTPLGGGGGGDLMTPGGAVDAAGDALGVADDGVSDWFGGL